MIANPFIYLFSLALIVTIFDFLDKRLNFLRELPIVIKIFFISFCLSFISFFENNDEVLNISILVLQNLLPAYIFLIFLDIKDFQTLKKRFFLNKIGCACFIGIKRYWSIIFISIFISFISQSLSFLISDEVFLSLAISFLLSILGSLINFGKKLDGFVGVSTTMLYIIVSIFGSLFGFYCSVNYHYFL